MREAPPDKRQPRTIRLERAPRTIATVIGVAAGLRLLLHVWQVILLLVIALVLAGTFSPLIGWLERHRVRRTGALGRGLLALVGAVGGPGALVIPAVAAQVGPGLENVRPGAK